MSARRGAALARLLERIGRLERLLCAAAFVLMSTALFADFILREIRGEGLFWARQVAVYAGIALAMLGIGLASSSGAHLRPRFADQLLPASWDAAISRLGELTTAALCLLFAGLALQLSIESQRLGEMATVIRIPIWPVQLLIPLAFLLAAIRHGLYGWMPSLHLGRKSGSQL